MSSTAQCQKGLVKDVFPPLQHIMCEHLDFGFPHHRLPEFCQDWASGTSLLNLAKKYNRRWEEMMLLILDQMEIGMIENRRGGIFGKKKGGAR